MIGARMTGSAARRGDRLSRRHDLACHDGGQAKSVHRFVTEYCHGFSIRFGNQRLELSLMVRDASCFPLLDWRTIEGGESDVSFLGFPILLAVPAGIRWKQWTWGENQFKKSMKNWC